MGSLTDHKPKCTVRLGGATLLNWQLRALRMAGIRQIAIVRGYLGERIKDSGLVYFENQDWANSNMVVSLQCASDWFRSSVCITSYSDIVYHHEIVSKLLLCRGDVALAYDVLWKALWQDRFEEPEVDAETLFVRDGQLVQIGQKTVSLDSLDGQFMGLVKFAPAGWSRVENLLSRVGRGKVRTLDMTSLLQRLVEENMVVAASPIHGRWCEVDSIEDLHLYEKRIASLHNWSHDWRF